MDKAYDGKFQKLNAANINVCIPKIQNTDSLKEEFLLIEGISSLEMEEGIFTSAVIKEFRGVDFSMNTMFYNLDDFRRLNRFEMVEEKQEIMLPLFMCHCLWHSLDSFSWEIPLHGR